MKTKFKITLGAFFLGLAVLSATLFSVETEALYNVLNTEVEVLAATECISVSSGNEGKCEAMIDGSGDVCTRASWIERKNCIETRRD